MSQVAPPLPLFAFGQSQQAKAAAARDRALYAVENNADTDWLERAAAALEQYLRTHPEFFVDDFWEGTDLAMPREARALGPVILRAARLGWMKKSGRWRPSVRSHLSEKPIWDSLLFAEGKTSNAQRPTPNIE